METELRDIMVRLQVQLEERDKTIKSNFENLVSQQAEIKADVKKINEVQTGLAVFRAEYKKDLFAVKMFAGFIGFLVTLVVNVGIKVWKTV